MAWTLPTAHGAGLGHSSDMVGRMPRHGGEEEADGGAAAGEDEGAAQVVAEVAKVHLEADEEHGDDANVVDGVAQHAAGIQIGRAHV